jgi:predicted TIM-barrel fold metal-dependent hydrolase
MLHKISRINFLKNTAISGAAVLLGNGFNETLKDSLAFSYPQKAVVYPYNIMKEVLKYRKIDAYANAYVQDNQMRSQLDYADRLGIEKLFIAVPIAKEMGKTPDEFRAYNNQVLNAVKKYPSRLVGQLTVNPAYPEASFEEIRRCIDQGMIGMKIYNQFKINDPLFYPVIEKFIAHKMIIHVHGESQLGVGGYRMKYNVNTTPNISVPEDFLDMAKRYPEAMFQYAHTGGGSDWEYACKAFKNYPNIYVDTGGSNNEENMIDFAVENLGEDRVFFGCDGSYYQGIGKILASGLNESQKHKIFFENYNNILKKSGRSIR